MSVKRVILMTNAFYSYPDALVYKGIYEVLSKIVDEINTEVNRNGIIMRAMDPAQIAYIYINVPKSAFVTLNVEEEGEYGLIVSIVNKALKSVKRGYRIDVRVIGDEVEKTIFGGVKKTYVFRSIMVPKPEYSPEELELENRITVLVDPIKEAIRDIELVSDRAILEIEGEVLKIRGGGETKYTLSLNRSSGAVIDMIGEPRAASSFNVDYLISILPLLKLTDTVTLEFKDQGPLRVTFDIPTGGSVIYLLAPYLG